MGLGPPRIHPIKHLCPVTGLCSAGSRMEGHYGIFKIVLPGKESLDPKRLKVRSEGLELLECLRRDLGIVFFVPKLDIILYIRKLAVEGIYRRDIILQALQFLGKLCAQNRIAPEIGSLHLFFKLLDPVLLPLYVKGFPDLGERRLVFIQFCF